jgi:hypothetical protein
MLVWHDQTKRWQRYVTIKTLGDDLWGRLMLSDVTRVPEMRSLRSDRMRLFGDRHSDWTLVMNLWSSGHKAENEQNYEENWATRSGVGRLIKIVPWIITDHWFRLHFFSLFSSSHRRFRNEYGAKTVESFIQNQSPGKEVFEHPAAASPSALVASKFSQPLTCAAIRSSLEQILRCFRWAQ